MPVIVDDILLNADIRKINDDDYILLEDLSYLFGYEVNYNTTTKEITIHRDVISGDRFVLSPTTLTYTLGEEIAYNNTLKIRTLSVPTVLNGHVYVPLYPTITQFTSTSNIRNHTINIITRPKYIEDEFAYSDELYSTLGEAEYIRINNLEQAIKEPFYNYYADIVDTMLPHNSDGSTMKVTIPVTNVDLSAHALTPSGKFENWANMKIPLYQGTIINTTAPKTASSEWVKEIIHPSGLVITCYTDAETKQNYIIAYVTYNAEMSVALIHLHELLDSYIVNSSEKERFDWLVKGSHKVTSLSKYMSIMPINTKQYDIDICDGRMSGSAKDDGESVFTTIFISPK